VKIDLDEASEIVSGVQRLWVAKGKKLLTYDLRKEKPDMEEIGRQIMGRSGNLRAPTFINKKGMFVGFHPEGLQDFLD
jgi:arsenate reductase-like glutaredoxin family protein